MYNKSSKIVALILVLVMMCSMLTACGSDNALDRIKAGETLVIDNGVTISEASAEQASELDWVELGQCKEYREFRNAFDKLFNVNIVTSSKGNSKNGCMYTIKGDIIEEQSDNTTLRDAFRNEVFNEYWTSKAVNEELSKLVSKAYTDVSESDSYCNYAILNAYFNIFGDGNGDKTFGVKQQLTREQFYTIVCKAGYGVGTLTQDASKFEQAYKNKGWNTYNVAYMAEMAPYGYLKVEDGSLNMSNVRTSITKLEAIYLVTNLYFSDYVDRVQLENKDDVFGYKNDDNMLERSGIAGEGTSKAVEANMLAYLISNNGSKGIDRTISVYLKTAEKLGLTDGLNVTNNLFAPMDKVETLKLLINAYKAENKVRGYATKEEYGAIDNQKETDNTISEVITYNITNEVIDDGFNYGESPHDFILASDTNGMTIEVTGGGLGRA